MKKLLIITCYQLGLWGFLGFIVTLLIGFIVCCAKLSPNVFYSSLLIFSAISIAITTFCVIKRCKKTDFTD